MKLFTCNECGHEVLSKDKPEAIKWSDGHVCRFFETKEIDMRLPKQRCPKCHCEMIECVGDTLYCFECSIECRRERI